MSANDPARCAPGPDSAESLGLLFHLAGKRYQALVHSELEKIGLYPGQDWTLIQLALHGPQTQTQLADRTQVDTSTLCRSLDRMTRSGFIERQPNPKDRRSMLVQLTDEGSRVLDDLDAARTNIENRLGEHLSGTERKQLADLLTRVLSGLAGAPDDGSECSA